MNEETPNMQPEKTGLDERRKTALLRYIAILFAVAFLLVLFSMLAQMRNSESTISQLNQSSTSALQKAEQLQEANRNLEEENAGLKEQLEALEEELANLQAQLEEEAAAVDDQSEEQKLLEAKIAAAEAEQKKTAQAYEELLTAMENTTPGKQEGNVSVSKALENLRELKPYLGQKGLEEYETLLEEGE